MTRREMLGATMATGVTPQWMTTNKPAPPVPVATPFTFKNASRWVKSAAIIGVYQMTRADGSTFLSLLLVGGQYVDIDDSPENWKLALRALDKP